MLQTLRGIAVGLVVDGRALPIFKEGFVGNLRPGFAELRVAVDSEELTYAYIVDGKKNAVMKKIIPSEEGGEKFYTLRIQIKTGLDGSYHTEYPNNQLRMVRVEPRGKFSCFEISLVSQEGDFFVTVQENYTGQCYRNDDDTVWCSNEHLRARPQVLAILEDLLKLNRKQLLPVMDLYRQVEEMPVPSALKAGQGRVIWWNDAQGFGMIETPVTNARVHYKAIEPRNGRRYLIPGEIVRYDRLGNPTVTKARATSFQREAYGVKFLPGA